MSGPLYNISHGSPACIITAPTSGTVLLTAFELARHGTVILDSLAPEKMGRAR
ncbi:hypothetical protein [Rhizobium mongolense]|uniref:Uncharacterized protein n=1 Tax=Rhizobium mongolense TaxID=57676 RepID=A0A7W6RVZ3_9HYPH|nr:hypothetical protein [Rhizobium mongolense]MBB4279626.1 hypothetical protein [Rhizobium mongolense]